MEMEQFQQLKLRNIGGMGVAHGVKSVMLQSDNGISDIDDRLHLERIVSNDYYQPTGIANLNNRSFNRHFNTNTPSISIGRSDRSPEGA